MSPSDSSEVMSTFGPTLLKVDNVHKHFKVGGSLLGGATLRAVDGVDFTIQEGETLGLVGESGCGKSTLARLLVRLERPSVGAILFRDVSLQTASGVSLKTLRREIQMIFQDPYGSLNPRMRVLDLVGEPLRNIGVGAGERRLRVTEMLMRCGLSASHLNRYPHQFSGGQRQRIGIARALIIGPSFIVADEPVSALDVSIQAQIINLLQDLQKQLGLTYLFIGHDLSVIRHVSDRVAVMYLGKIVEIARNASLFAQPLHPYTWTLLASVPVLDSRFLPARRPVLARGELPSAITPPSGCRFHPRCPIAQFPLCAEVEPPLSRMEPDRLVACHFPGHMGASP